MAADIVFLPDGWVRVHLTGREEPDVTALAATEQRGDRTVIRHLLISAEHVNSAAVHRFPIGWLESVINVQGLAAGFREQATDQTRTDVLTKEIDRLLSADLPPRLQDRGVSGEPPRAKLQRPTGQDPDAFYRLVSIAHDEAVQARKPPGPAIAEEAGVPVRTVHGWIREARRRGHLPPATRGRP